MDQPKPLSSFRYSRARDVVLASLARGLGRTSKLLWYGETLTLSARFGQWLRLQSWSREAKYFHHRAKLFELMKARVPQNFVGFEFGVATGAIGRWWARNAPDKVSRWHGFDTFGGLPEPWIRAGVPVMEENTFSPASESRRFPDYEAGFSREWHEGLIQETLRALDVTGHQQKLIFVDVDLFDPALSILKWCVDNCVAGDLIYLDEAFDPWNERKALEEAVEMGLRVKAIGYTGSALLLTVE